MKKIAIVTSRALPEPDPDQELLLGALRTAGLDAGLFPTIEAEPAAFDLCVIRSTRDYYKHPGSFLRWVENRRRNTPDEPPGHPVEPSQAIS